MSQSPHRDDPSLDLETASSEELERALISEGETEKEQAEQPISTPPPTRRCDSPHREILRQPFLLDR